MKTTFNLDDELLFRVKRLAAQRGTTSTKIIEDALREALAQQPPGEAYELSWKPTKGTEWPAVDPADRSSLYDLLEESRS
ncbi:MAG: CopG family transcriptional regulator [Actinomycetota bacterium]